MESITPDEKIIDAFVTILSALPPDAQREIISRIEWNLQDSNTAFTNEVDMKNVNATEASDPS